MKKTMRPLAFSLFICCFAAAICSKAINRVSDRLSIRDGLSNNHVTDITQDGYGYLWIATDNGLNRFDGERFTVFSEKDKSLKGNSVNAIYYDKTADCIWIGSKKGIDIIDCRTLKGIEKRIPNEIAGKSIADFAPAGEDGIYILGNYGFVACFDRDADSCRVYREPDFNGLIMSMYSAAADHDGRLIAGQENYGLSFIDLNRKTVENYMHSLQELNSLRGNNVRAVLTSRRGDVYAGTDHGVCRFDSVTRTFQPLELNDIDGTGTRNGNIVSLIELADGTMLASCDKVLFQDSFGNIWAGTAGNGLEFIPAEPPVFNKISSAQGYAGANIVNKEGIPAAITACLDNKNARIAAMVGNGGETLVSIAGEGLFTVNNRSGKAARIATPYEKDFANTICNLGDTIMLLGTQHGLYEYRNGVVSRNEKISAATGYLVPNGIVADAHGRLWIGTYGNGIFIFDKDDNLVNHITTDNGLASNAVKQLLSDSRGWLWSAGQDGVSVVKDIDHPERIENFSYDNGLPDISVRSIVEDNEGNIWLASNNALCRYNAKTDSIESFGERLRMTESTFDDRAAACSGDGLLYFGTIDGIYSFRPQEPNPRASAGILNIVEYSILTESSDGHIAQINHPNPGQSIVIPHGQNAVKILFSNPDFSTHGKQAYFYKLDDAGDQWLRMPDTHEVVLNNLSAGDHTLRVRAGSGEEDIMSVAITVERPWWLMWWAVAFYVILGAGLVILILRYGRHSKAKAAPTDVQPTVDETCNDNLSVVDKEFLERFTSLVEQNMSRPDLDMEFLQDALGMSHSTLYRRLKNITGMSGNEFIKKCRLRKGHEMLSQGFSVSETAYACGFSDPGYFRTCFKNEYGKAPSEMRKK